MKYFIKHQKSKIRLNRLKIGIAKSSGFTLMEVLIAMAIGLVVLVGALSYFSTGVRSSRTASAYSRMHENASRAVALITRDLQLAGFYGFGGSANVNNILDDEGTLYTSAGKFVPPFGSAFLGPGAIRCGQNYIFPIQLHHTTPSLNRALPFEYYTNYTDFQREVYDQTNFEIKDGDDETTDCLYGISDNSSILLMRGALDSVMISDTSRILSQKIPPVGAVSATRLYTAAIPTANLNSKNVFHFYGNKASETSDASLEPQSYSQAHADGLIVPKASGEYFPIFGYQYHIYYLRDFFQSPGSDKIPTLARVQLVPGTDFAVDTAPQRLVAGVERINYIWGVDNKGLIRTNSGEAIGDGVTDYWTSTLSGDEFAQVNAVRVQVLVRSQTVDPQYDDSPNTYYFDDPMAQPYKCTDHLTEDAQICKYRRMLYESSTNIRNCSLRRRTGLLETGGC